MENQRDRNSISPKSVVLIADDDIAIKKIVGANLTARGYQVLLAADGIEAWNVFVEHSPDLIILDILMPHLDGFEVCSRIRMHSSVPIIFLSAYNGEDQRVRCLDMGADDFVAKPFCMNELLARIRAILHRFKAGTPVLSSFRCGELEIDFKNRCVCINRREVDVTPTEFSILYYLALNAGKTVSYNYLLHSVWGLKNNLNTGLLWVNTSPACGKN
jgi:two-component system, OmpR family, KDP operon response regulator KdpE